jgi:tetraacyldisaccharide 4'-kinase
MSRAIERIWAADGPAAWALAPLSWIFGAAVALKNLLHDTGVLRAKQLALPAVSVGNLSVGGTGKTPVSAWVAAELARRGAKPAIVLRGYGDDEVLVHRALNPGVPVIVDADRVRGAAAAKLQGATIVVLDDAFQHRRAARDADIVLVAAEQGAAHRLLPAGPLREGRGALRRASVLVVTRKSASREAAEAVGAAWTGFSGAPARAQIALAAGALRQAATGDGPALLSAGAAAGEARDVTALNGAKVLAISGIGAPDAFAAQLSAAGAQVTPVTYGDHHAYSPNDARVLAARAEREGMPVCTLKDAVKLAPHWPRQGPTLWYLSQAVFVERGGEVLEALLDRLAAAAQS